jgi:hypothetical protein
MMSTALSELSVHIRMQEPLVRWTTTAKRKLVGGAASGAGNLPELAPTAMAVIPVVLSFAVLI